jgi:hypothetical protein
MTATSSYPAKRHVSSDYRNQLRTTYVARRIPVYEILCGISTQSELHINRLTIKHLHSSFPGDIALASGDETRNGVSREMMYPPLDLELAHTSVDPPER